MVVNTIKFGQQILKKTYNTSKSTLPSFKGNEISSQNKGTQLRFAHITSHYDEGGTMVFGCIPDDYVTKKTYFVKGYTTTRKFGKNKGQQVFYPDKWEEEKYSLPHYHIDKLWTGGKGTGTQAVQNIVQKSLNNEKTMGRVTLDASCIDGETSPAGFYYKLGFRFNNSLANKTMEEWLEQGGKRENAPFITGLMHLPKENIEHCLNYGQK